jgi:hypothetical protein
MNREFDKELYYSGKNPNSYLISGVKSQYENMKNCNSDPMQCTSRSAWNWTL